MMARLLFDKPAHHAGKNVTVRRGIKWASIGPGPVELEAEGMVRRGRILDVALFHFQHLPGWVYRLEHDPACHTYEGLRAAMARVYPTFDAKEIVSVVSYELNEYD